MLKIALNASTKTELDKYLVNPSHALCLTGPPGAGKGHTARILAQELLNTTREDAIYSIGDDSEIGIDTVRRIQRFLLLKKPGTKEFRRVVLIENIQRLSGEAQNAMLKTLEEPPDDSIFILTAPSLADLKPTVRSRCQVIVIKPLTLGEAKQAFSSDIEKLYALSGGYAGLLYALINDPDHKLTSAISQAKNLLQSPVFERLKQMDELVKAKGDLNLFFYALQRVLSAASTKAPPATLRKLITAQRALYDAEQDYKRNANPKILLTDLALQL